MRGELNRSVFEACDVVRFYAGSEALQKPESTILEMLAPRLASMRMLDVGVGGGRTTRHFAHKLQHYIGVDYSEAMVKVCRETFDPSLRFEVCDMRDLSMFADASFDFVLVSFNGLDYVAEDRRLTVLAEIRRVLAPGGHLCFSTHNLLAVPDLFQLPRTLDPLAWIEGMLKFLRLRLNNDPLDAIMMRRATLLNDGAYAFRARTYYTTPEEQLAQLAKAGMVAPRVYSLATGQEVEPSMLASIRDPWLYFLCEMPAADTSC